jgi:ribosome modulation factor
MTSASKGELVAALKEGMFAYELGEHSGDCPYRPADPLRAAWLRGYKAARSKDEPEGGQEREED